MSALHESPIDDRASYRAIVRPAGGRHIEVIDQRALPHAFVMTKIASADAAALAIRRMIVRGAPLIGAVGAYGLALALDRDASDAALGRAHAALDATLFAVPAEYKKIANDPNRVLGKPVKQ